MRLHAGGRAPSAHAPSSCRAPPQGETTPHERKPASAADAGRSTAAASPTDGRNRRDPTHRAVADSRRRRAGGMHAVSGCEFRRNSVRKRFGHTPDPRKSNDFDFATVYLWGRYVPYAEGRKSGPKYFARSSGAHAKISNVGLVCSMMRLVFNHV